MGPHVYHFVRVRNHQETCTGGDISDPTGAPLCAAEFTQRRHPCERDVVLAQGWHGPRLKKIKKMNVLMGKSSINDGSSIARFVTLKNKNIWIELEQQCLSLAIEKGNLESEDHVIMPKHDLRP